MVTTGQRNVGVGIGVSEVDASGTVFGSTTPSTQSGIAGANAAAQFSDTTFNLSPTLNDGIKLTGGRDGFAFSGARFRFDFTPTSGGGGGSGVPEPSSLALILMAAIPAVRRRRKRS